MTFKLQGDLQSSLVAARSPLQKVDNFLGGLAETQLDFNKKVEV